MSPLRTRKRSARANRGYTLVEVMVALGVLAVGITGVLSMENAAIASNRRAQEVTLATNIARRWQERLRVDSLQWNSPSARRPTSDLATDTQYLCVAVGCGTNGSARAGQWIVPATPTGTTESAAFDAFGNEVALDATTVRYCVNTRVTWLRADAVGLQGLLRAEVRVWWYREGVGTDATYASCGAATSLDALGSDTARLHFVYSAEVLGGNPL